MSKMIVSAIVATASNGVIGMHNDIPWYLPADLKYFKKITKGHHILMGRKTFQSIGRPLANRTNIVITRDPFFIASGTITVHSIEEGLSIADGQGESEVFIIGGGQIYEQSQKYWDRIYQTEVKLEPEGEVYFPVIDKSSWERVWSASHKKDEKNNVDYSFNIYEKKP